MNKWIKDIQDKKDYKRFVGKKEKYDEIGMKVFSILLENGLKKTSNVLDIGCGSLRVGRYLIPYLYKDRYYGYDPNYWLIEEAIKNELTKNILIKKKPSLFDNMEDILSDFDLIFAHSIFVHAGLNDLKSILYDVKHRLKDNGAFIFNFIEGKDNIKYEWSYPQGITYSKKTIFEILDYFGFKYKEINEGDKHIWIQAIL